MEIVHTAGDLRKALEAKGGTVGFVPTMGALHDGHLSLVRYCGSQCDTVVVSIFVNPTQFNDQSDLAAYPRTVDADTRLLETVGADVVFVPSVAEIYPEPDTRVFEFGILDKVMEGEHRPGHFNGVGQVVSRLFDLVRPDKAFFGEKDFQQLAIIRNMVDNLGIDIEIVGCPIVRGTDGLALSSRNALLSDTELLAAPNIYRVLNESTSRTETMSIDELKKWVIAEINSVKELEVEYFDIVNCLTLQSLGCWAEAEERQGCIAVRCGKIRLIDNIRYAD